MTPIEGGPAQDTEPIILRPKGGMNELMRGQKADRDSKTEARQERFFTKKEEPDTPTIAKAREEAEAARLAADEASASLRRRRAT